MIDDLLRTPCTVHHVTGQTADEEGHVSPEIVDLPTVCHVQPLRLTAIAAEAMRGELVTMQRWRCWLPADAVINAGDTITIGTITRQVHGQPEEWESPAGNYPHKAVELRVLA